MTIQELEKTIELYGRSIYSFCLKLTDNKDRAEDLYQDIWLYAIRYVDKLKLENNVKSYLFSVTLYIWKNQKRKLAWRNRIAPEEMLIEEKDEEIQISRDDGLSVCLSDEQRLYVQRAVGDLKDIYKIPVLLFYMEDMSVTEISKIMKLPTGTVKSRLSYARRILRKKLEGYING